MDFRDLGAITIFTEDLGASRAFYGTAWGLREIFADDVSSAYDLGNTMINVLDVSAAADLVAPAHVGGCEAGVRAQLSVFVEDVDAAGAQLARAGVEVLSGPIDRAWGMRTLSFLDPSGHLWELAQEIFPS